MQTKNQELQKRISELKQRSGHIAYRSLAVDQNGVLVETDLDKRIIKGYLIQWGKKNFYGEKVIKGACAKSISERGPNSSAKYKITFLWMHDDTDPLALFATLKEDDYGLYFETMPLDDVPNADRCITQIRSGTLNQFSVGFYYIWDKIEWDDKDDSLVLKEIDLMEGSVVTIGADEGTYAIRSGKMTYEELHDEVDAFINTLPRKDRLQARRLFTLQKSLVATEKRTRSELGKHKPPKKEASKKQGRKINYDFLTKNL